LHGTTLIIGAKTPEQLEGHLAASSLKLTSEQLAILNTTFAPPPEYPGWMIVRQNDDRTPKTQ
jgi:aryl-alcohol dehydrogenase-like predicted oxidoreductase